MQLSPIRGGDNNSTPQSDATSFKVFRRLSAIDSAPTALLGRGAPRLASNAARNRRADAAAMGTV